MEKFFKKHGHHLDERHALDLIHNKIEEAKCNLREGKECYVALMEADGMIQDIFEIKRINPEDYQNEYNQEQGYQDNQQQEASKYARGSRGMR